MLRITENFENRQTIRLRLDGTISAEALMQINHAIAQNRDGCDCTVILDMGGVEYMNDHAARELVKLRNDQLRFVNCSPFIATLFEMITEAERKR